MTTAALDIPPSNRMVPGSNDVAPAPYPEPTDLPDSDPREVAAQWVSSFNELVKGGSTDVTSLFLENSYWRDFLCLSWDYHTLQGPRKINALVHEKVKKWRIESLALDDSSITGKPIIAPFNVQGTLKGVQTFLTVETDIGRGRGVVRLLPDAGRWKAYTLYTVLQELKGHEELNKARRPQGVDHGAHAGRLNWQERRIAEQNLEGMEGENEPTVLIVGSGQGGLTSAAALHQVGVRALIIDRNARVGDNWRNRYHQLVLHDPVWYDHMPYLNFPPSWPVFTPKDKLAEWFEIYASAMELNVWTQTTIKDSKWDDSSRRWTVTLEREKQGKKETRTVHPRHIIQATGHSGEASFPSDITGIDDFKGETLVHSSQFQGPKSNIKGKKAVIVGSCNSAHDIAQDFYEHGYDVTMVQRSSTFVVSSSNIVKALSAVYSENGPPLDDADLLNFSLPNAIVKRLQMELTVQNTERDADLLRGLQKAGFALDGGPDNSGLWLKYFMRGGGYYIDVGASQLIVDGKVKIKHGHEVKQIKAHSLVFDDGEELEADEIIFATGYGNMRDTARKLFGDELADRVGDVWGLDEEGEIRTMWRRSGHPGFWFFGGNLALCRYYSKLLAIQIKGLEVGLMEYEGP